MSEQATEPALTGIRVGDRVYPSPDDFTIDEAKVIKRESGLTPQELIVGVQHDPTDPTYLQPIAWIVLHREDETVEWDDVRIGKASIGEFFVVPEQETNGRPPGSARKKSSSARPTTSRS